MDNGEWRIEVARKARYLITALWADTFIFHSQFSIFHSLATKIYCTMCANVV